MQENRVIAIDIDGVLTDGKLYMDHRGEKLFKSFNSRDIRAIRELIYNGIRVIFVSADDSKINKQFAMKCGAEFEYVRDKQGIHAHIAIGDDTWDIPMLKNAQIKFCPADADSEVKKIEGIKILPISGGNGVIAEMIHHVL